MDIFLRAKAWQLFLATFVLPMGLLVLRYSMEQNITNPHSIFNLIAILFYAIHCAWDLTLGTALFKFTPAEIRIKPTKFKFGVIYGLAYFPFKIIFYFNKPIAYQMTSNESLLSTPLSLLSTFFTFYIIYYISKHMVMAEKEKSVSFSEYRNTFFQFLFSPVGIWFFQPRINKLYAQHTQNLAV